MAMTPVLRTKHQHLEAGNKNELEKKKLGCRKGEQHEADVPEASGQNVWNERL